MINIRGVNSNRVAGNPNDSHWMVLAGIRGDMTPSGTTLTLYDTAPNGLSPLIVDSYSYLKAIWPQFIFQCMWSNANQSKKLY
jgi:hypothetical protein